MGCSPSSHHHDDAAGPVEGRRFSSLEELSSRFSRTSTVSTIGELPNIGIAEARLDYTFVMKSAEARSALLEFCVTTGGQEQLLECFERLQSFRRTFGMTAVDSDEHHRMPEEAMSIIEEFLTPLGPKALDLPSTVLQAYQDRSSFAANMFDAARRLVYTKIEREIFTQFIASQMAADLLSRYPELSGKRNSVSSILSRSSVSVVSSGGKSTDSNSLDPVTRLVDLFAGAA